MDETVRLWDADTGAALHTLESHSNWVNEVTFSPDGRRLASCSRDMTVRLWDADTGAALHTLEGHSGSVNAVTFSPDGRRLASCSWDSNGLPLYDAYSRQMQLYWFADVFIKSSNLWPDLLTCNKWWEANAVKRCEILRVLPNALSVWISYNLPNIDSCMYLLTIRWCRL
jgi:WD40 repeat protein